MATTNARIPTATLNSIATAIKGKDGGGNMTAAQMADRIAAISTKWTWEKPSDWPNLRTIVKTVSKGSYAHRIAFLVYIDPANTISDYNVTTDSGNGVVSDSSGTVSGNTITWSTSGYHWFVLLSNNTEGVRHPTTNGGVPTESILWACGDDDSTLYDNSNISFPSYAVRLEAITNCSFYIETYVIQNTSSLKIIDSIDFTALPNSNANGLFRSIPNLIALRSSGNCVISMPSTFNGGPVNLEELPETIDFSGMTVRNNVFVSATHLEKFVDYMDFSSANNGSGTFGSCNAIKEIPKVIVPNASLLTSSTQTFDFSAGRGVSKDSVLAFAEFGNIPPGHPSAGKSGKVAESDYPPQLKLSSVVRLQFTEAELTALNTAITDNGWELIWE